MSSGRAGTGGCMTVMQENTSAKENLSVRSLRAFEALPSCTDRVEFI
jgi:hypothetical protein